MAASAYLHLQSAKTVFAGKGLFSVNVAQRTGQGDAQVTEWSMLQAFNGNAEMLAQVFGVEMGAGRVEIADSMQIDIDSTSVTEGKKIVLNGGVKVQKILTWNPEPVKPVDGRSDKTIAADEAAADAVDPKSVF